MIPSRLHQNHDQLQKM